MSGAGIYGVITNGLKSSGECLMIGEGVPQVHRCDGLAVYLVIEDPRGMPVRLKDGSRRHLLAYPSHWPGPGRQTPNRWLYAYHETLRWESLIPIFELEEHTNDF